MGKVYVQLQQYKEGVGVITFDVEYRCGMPSALLNYYTITCMPGKIIRKCCVLH